MSGYCGCDRCSGSVPSGPGCSCDRCTSGHQLTHTADGARCSCGQSFSVWNTRRGSGWSTAHDFTRSRNLVRGNAKRHSLAAQRREGVSPGTPLIHVHL